MQIQFPSEEQIETYVRPYLASLPDGMRMGFAIGSLKEAEGAINTAIKHYFFGNSNDNEGRPQLYDESGNTLPLGGQTNFEIASVTETFTGTLMNFIDLHDDQRWLGDLPTTEKNRWAKGTFSLIPLASLVNYTSGLPADNVSTTDEPDRVGLGDGPYSLNRMRRYLNHTLYPTHPGRRYSYSNLAFAMAGALYPDINDNNSFEHAMMARVLEPLSMSG